MIDSFKNFLRKREDTIGGVCFLRSVALLLVFSFSSCCWAAESLPLPRFVSLASGRVNLRVGPSKVYPISWEFLREGMPVEIFREYESWRKIRDMEGTEGWVHKSMLSGKRRVIFLQGKHALLHKPEPDSAVVAWVESGVIGDVKDITKLWCRVKIDRKVEGWVQKSKVWGVYPQEERPPSKCWVPFLCREAKTK